MDEHLSDSFGGGLRRLGLALSTQQLEQLARYRRELLDWNTRINLTAITDPEEVLSKHFLDSLSVLLVYDRPVVRLLDMGAGAGFPGLPLKIVRPQWQVVLLEATGKKVTFMHNVIETLGLNGVEAVHGRAEELARNSAPIRPANDTSVSSFAQAGRKESDYRGKFDVVTARAVASLRVLLEYAAPYCRVGGRMIFLKKGALDEELAQGRRAAGQVGAVFRDDVVVSLPGLEDGRRLLVWEQQRVCPAQFPRGGAVIAKKPLG